MKCPEGKHLVQFCAKGPGRLVKGLRTQHPPDHHLEALAKMVLADLAAHPPKADAPTILAVRRKAKKTEVVEPPPVVEAAPPEPVVVVVAPPKEDWKAVEKKHKHRMARNREKRKARFLEMVEEHTGGKEHELDKLPVTSIDRAINTRISDLKRAAKLQKLPWYALLRKKHKSTKKSSS